MRQTYRGINFEKLMLVFGFFAGAPIISFAHLTGYVYFLCIVGLMSLIKQLKGECKVEKRKDNILFAIYVLWVFASYFVCWNRMPELWTSDLLNSIVQFVLVIFIYITLDSGSKGNTLCKLNFVKGIYYSSVAQMVWAFLQWGLYIAGVDLNNLIFNQVLHMTSDEATQISYYGIKLSGFCWNSANMAPLMVFGFLYSRNTKIKLLFLIVSLISNSKTLMAGILICIFMSAIVPIFENLRIKRKNIILAFVVALVGIAICFVFWSNVSVWADKVLDLFNVFENIGKEPSTYAHFRYLSTIPEVTRRNSPISNVFGFGPGCSGFVFSKYFNQYNGIKWSLECDYANILWQYGYIGFLLYYTWLLSGINNLRKIDNKYISLFVSFLMMGFMYNITFNWVFLLILLTFSLGRNGYSIFSSNDN